MVPASPADAVNLAGDLETLMDAFTTEGIDWHALELAVDSDYSTYFEITRHFVQIASENWPKILAERQASDPAQRRNALMEAEAKRLTRERPDASHHRRGLDRLGAGDRKPHGRDRAPSQRRHCAARPRHGSRRGELGDHRRRGRRRNRSGAQPPASLAQRACSTDICASRAPTSRCWARCRNRRGAQPSALGSPAPADTTDRWSLIPAEDAWRSSRERLRRACHRRSHGRARGGSSPSPSRCAKRSPIPQDRGPRHA